MTIQGDWVLWNNKVPKIEVETHKVGSPDIVVPTLDTVRHEALLYTWLAEHKPMVLCGPPGSGKTMTLFSALRALPDMEVGVGRANIIMCKYKVIVVVYTNLRCIQAVMSVLMFMIFLATRPIEYAIGKFI